MIKVILFDCDGPIIKRDKRFMERLLEQGLALNEAEVQKFFKGEFLEIEKGRGDLKQALQKLIKSWEYSGSVDELIRFWFEGEAKTDKEMLNYIQGLRSKGIKCFLSTNNEKYRTEYLWNTVDLKNYLDGLYSSCYLGYMKPQIEYWQEIYKTLLSAEKSEVLVLDDKLPAIESAKQFGFKAALYENFDIFRNTLENYIK